MITAVDFDGCLCRECYPDIGSPNLFLINSLIDDRNHGDKLILWTCRCGDRLQEAVNWCRTYGLEFDAINANLPESIAKYGSDSRKVFADLYIDDKGVKPYWERKKKKGEFNINEVLGNFKF